MITSLSLFSGCLGFDLGLEKAGIKAIAYVDKDVNCRSTIAANRPNIPIFEDVFDKKLYKLKADVVVGGPPCQSFSTIGKRLSLEDERGKAIFGFIEVVKHINPKMFVLENVTGILSAKNDVLNRLIESFSNLGYTVNSGVINAIDFGVPQTRKRFLMIGAKNKKVELPKPSTKNITYLKEAIKDLENDPGEYLEFSNAISALIKKVPEGQNWKSLNKEDQSKALGKANRSSGGLTGFCRRLDYSKPSPTLLTSPTQKATLLCHPTKNRPLSVREYKRIQGFPDNWIISGSIAEQYKQIGNAVPIPMAKAIGGVIKLSLKKV